MKKHIFLAMLLAGVLGLSALAAGQKYQLDIALEGPWILYQDTQTFLVTVLVAIAPLAAAMDEPDDFQHHHLPQISTGEGYYIGDNGIYCLAFDRKCAVQGAAALVDDHGYPPSGILQISPGMRPWPWPQKSSKNVAIILPMPDVYSNDGLWQLRFRNKYDIKKTSVTHSDVSASIGIVLHYQKNVAGVLQLFSCDATTPNATNCIKQAKDRDGNDVVLRNTGKLRMQLRAPDADSYCDHHVRFAYHQMFKIFESSSSNEDYAFIEPAKHIKIDAATGTASGQYEDESSGNHDCFDDDHDAYQDQATPAGSPFHAKLNGDGREETQEVNTLNQALADLNKLNKDAKSPFLDRAISNMNAASEESNKVTGIRKISVDRHFEALLSDAVALIDTFKREKRLAPDDLTTLLKVETFLRILADGTKNGADCRAPLVLLQ